MFLEWTKFKGYEKLSSESLRRWKKPGPDAGPGFEILHLSLKIFRSRAVHLPTLSRRGVWDTIQTFQAEGVGLCYPVHLSLDRGE